MLASLLMVLCLQMAAQTWEDVKVGTSTRKTLTYVPKNVEKSSALVISLHGFNQDPEFQQNQTQWNALADTEVFIVTYPLANNKMWDTNGMGDVKFVEAVYTLPKALEKGAKYTLTMKMRTSADCAELGFWPIWNASANKNQWGGSDDVQYLAAYHVEAGDWKTLTWDFTANFTLDTFQFVFGKYGGTLDIDDMVLVKEGTSENLIANSDFSARNIQGWSTNWNGPSYFLANEAYASTGIEKPAVATMMKSADKAYYTLQGVKVIRPTKGIYIHGGKKIVIK